MSNRIEPKIINPDSSYKTYTGACKKNNVTPISEIEFFKGLILGLSGSLSATSIKEGIAAVTKYPVDEDGEIWCLLVPCSDGVVRLIYGPPDGIDETLNNLHEKLEEKSLTTGLAGISSIDQF